MEIIVSLLVILATAFLFLGSLGVLRLPDFYMRLHGASLASTLGIGFLLSASFVFFSPEPGLQIKELLIALFLLLSAPISSHMMAKAALHERIEMLPTTKGHETTEQLRRQEFK